MERVRKLKKLEDRKFANVPAEVRANIKQCYAQGALYKNVQKLVARLDETLCRRAGRQACLGPPLAALKRP